jgi:hypothetical protein
MVKRHEIAMMKLDIARTEQVLQVMSRATTFAQDPDEREWTLVTNAHQRQPYSMQQLDSIRQSARKLQHRPAGRNILQTYQDFIIGKDAAITTDDEDKKGEVQAYWDEWAKWNKWDMKTKEIVKRLYRDGEVFLRWFLPSAPKGHLSLRFVDPEQIRPSANGRPTFGISISGDDYEDINYYHRSWSAPNGTVMTEQITPEEMDHWKIGADSDEKRGISIFMGLGRYITDYEKWLDDRIAINRIRHIWNVVAEPLNATTAISTVQNKFADVTRETPVDETPNKKMPKPGSVLFSKGMKWDLKALKINAADTKDDGRAIQLQLAIGANMPEYIVRGDASNANMASSMVSESPFVRAMESGQDFVEKIFTKAYTRVIEWGISQGLVPTQSTKTTVTFNTETGEDETKTETVDTSTDCTVNFAALIHRDEKADTEAKQIQVGEEFISRKTASEELGFNYNEEQDQINREKRQRMTEDREQEEQFGANQDTGDNE